MSLITHHLVFMAQVFLSILVIPHRLLEDLILKIYASRMELPIPREREGMNDLQRQADITLTGNESYSRLLSFKPV